MTRLLLSGWLLLGSGWVAAGQDWPEFRGPTGQGIVTGQALPLHWGLEKNIVWKQPIPGQGWSSPVIVAGRIYLTTSVPGGTQPPQSQSLRALCLDARTGKLLWNREVFRQDAQAPRIHAKNSHASPTPLVSQERLYVHFGHQGTACLDLEGHVLWRSRELSYAPVHGNGGSPVLVAGRLVVCCDGASNPFLAALDAGSGKVIWKTERKSGASRNFSFSTPLVIRVGERSQIVTPASDLVAAYEVATGKEIWRVRYQGYSLIPRPVYGHGLVFISTGYDSPSVLAIRPDGEGDVTDTHVAWKIQRGAPRTPSPLLEGDELYLLADEGLVSCLDARSGKVHWQQRLPGQYSASPLVCKSRLYCLNEHSITTVLATGKQFRALARNELLLERSLASPAAADGALFLRTETDLYRIEGKN